MPAPPVGLDITSTALHAVMLKKRGKTYALVRHASMSLPRGLVFDGEVVDVAGLSDAIRRFWEQANIRDKHVAIGVANQRSIVRVISLSRIKNAKELRNTIGFEVLDHLPVPMENIVYDYHTVGSFRDDLGVERQRHVVVMTYRESMERFRDAVVGAGLKLRRTDLSAFALMRSSLRSVHGADGGDGAAQPGVVAICEIGELSTNLVIARDGICELNRQLAFGTTNFVQMLSEHFGWSADDAARVRDEAGVLPLGGIETPGDPYTDSRHVMQYVADQFAAELRTSFDYYLHAQDGQERVARLVICGPGAMLRGYDQRLATELGMPVSLLDLSPYLDSGSLDTFGAEQARYGTAFGLALEDAA